MCKHQYSKTVRGQANSCQYNTIIVDLPLDDEGLCLFHSSNLQWKESYNFQDYFFEAIKMIANDEKLKFIFIDFIFPNDITLNNIAFNKVVDFSSSVFHKKVIFKGVSLSNMGASFNKTEFHDVFIFKGSRKASMDFSYAIFQSSASFSDIVEENPMMFIETQFQDGFTMENCIFNGMVNFDDAKFSRKQQKNMTTFINVKFDNIVSFQKAIFESPVKFDTVMFNHEAQYIDTEFKMVQDFTNYYDYALNFSKISLGEKGYLIIRSTDPMNKTFKQEVKIGLNDNNVGKILFENVNFNLIEEKSRSKLWELSKLGMVEVGDGCIKYRFKSKVKTITTQNVALVVEFIQVFTSYFLHRNGINLGMEIVERSEKGISFFYFSDEDISTEDFDQYLKEIQSEILNIHECDNMPQSMDELISICDVKFDWLHIALKIAMREKCFKWGNDDYENLLKLVTNEHYVVSSKQVNQIQERVKKATEPIIINIYNGMGGILEMGDSFYINKVENSAIGSGSQNFNFSKEENHISEAIKGLSQEQKAELASIIKESQDNNEKETIGGEIQKFLKRNGVPVTQSIAAATIFEIAKKLLGL